jgi:branched-chain amino acid transport system substrate-binding protein
LSGAFAPSTVDLLDTFKTWVTYTNDHGGINGHPIKAVYTDDAGSSVTALNNVKTMVGNGIQMIFGPIAFGTALQPIEPQGGFVNYIIAPIDPLYDPKVMPTTFDTYPTTADVNSAIVTFAQQHKYTKWAIVNDGTLDTEAASLTAKAAAGAGATVVRNDTVNPAAVDFSSEALKIKNSGADAIMMYLIGPDVALFLQAIEAAGITTPILNNSTASASDLTAAPVSLLQNQVFEAVTSTSVLVNGAPSQGYVPYVSLLQKLYGKSAGGSAVGTEFDTYDLMGYAIAQAGGTDPTKVKQVMESISHKSFLSNLVNYTFNSTDHGIYSGTGYNGFVFVHPLPMSKTWPGFFPSTAS